MSIETMKWMLWVVESAEHFEGKKELAESLRQEIEQAEKPVNLNSIELYRMQMAAISGASLGYWQAGDPLHPDYDTVAFRDVVNLYRDYSNLRKQAEKQEPKYDPVAIVKISYGTAIFDCPSCNKQLVITFDDPPRKEWVSLTDEDMYQLRREGAHHLSDRDFLAIEAKLKEKNT